MSKTRLSKYDQHKQGQVEEQYRQMNIDKLEAQLAEAKGILSVIPHDESNLELMKERREVAKHIKQLEEWLADERECIAEAQANSEVIDKILRNMI